MCPGSRFRKSMFDWSPVLTKDSPGEKNCPWTLQQCKLSSLVEMQLERGTYSHFKMLQIKSSSKSTILKKPSEQKHKESLLSGWYRLVWSPCSEPEGLQNVRVSSFNSSCRASLIWTGLKHISRSYHHCEVARQPAGKQPRSTVAQWFDLFLHFCSDQPRCCMFISEL